MPDLQLPPNIPKHRRPLSFGDHQTGDRIELRPLDLIKFPAHHADAAAHITKLVGTFVFGS